jgi:hypothetical protein
MSDFLSNLIGRSFTDAPLIQPRVPSLFETTEDEFLDEPQSSGPSVPAAQTLSPKDAPAPVSKLSPTRETATPKSMANVSDATAEEHRSKPDTHADQKTPVIAQTSRLREQTAELRNLDAAKKERASERFSEPRLVQSRRRKEISTIEERSSTSPPIIRVTIGRVEVRAVHPPPPAPKQAKPAPTKLSLEDYLHERKRGSR